METRSFEGCEENYLRGDKRLALRVIFIYVIENSLYLLSSLNSVFDWHLEVDENKTDRLLVVLLRHRTHDKCFIYYLCHSVNQLLTVDKVPTLVLQLYLTHVLFYDLQVDVLVISNKNKSIKITAEDFSFSLLL